MNDFSSNFPAQMMNTDFNNNNTNNSHSNTHLRSVQMPTENVFSQNEFPLGYPPPTTTLTNQNLKFIQRYPLVSNAQHLLTPDNPQHLMSSDLNQTTVRNLFPLNQQHLSEDHLYTNNNNQDYTKNNNQDYTNGNLSNKHGAAFGGVQGKTQWSVRKYVFF